MSGELGFQENFRRVIYEPLQAFRGNDGMAGRECSFIDFVQHHAVDPVSGQVGLTNTAGEPLSWDDIWCDLGMDPAAISLDNLISLSGDTSRIAPEIVRQFILEGMEMEDGESHLTLCAGTENVDSLNVTSPWVRYTDADPQDIREAETIPEAGITWGEKSVKIRKSAIAIKLTDEILLSVKLPLLGWFLKRVGIELRAKLYKAAVNTMINGDQTDGSDACTVVGVGTEGTLAFDDFVVVWVRGRLIAYRWAELLTNEAMANVVLKISQFRDPAGAGQVPVTIQSRNRIIPAAMPHMISADMADDQVMLYDPRRCMLYLVFRGLLVENERIIMRQINGSAASIISGFTTLDNNARIIIDRSLAFASNGFPAAMTPMV